MSKQVFIIVLDCYAHMYKNLDVGGCYCNDWRSVRRMLRNEYKDVKLKIYRRRWSPRKNFWSLKG